MNLMDWAQFTDLANKAMVAKNELADAFLKHEITCSIETVDQKAIDTSEKRIYEKAAVAEHLLSRILSEFGKLVTRVNAEHKKPQLTCPYCGSKVDIYGELFEGTGEESGMGICCQKCGKFCMIVFKLEKEKELEK